MGNIDRHQDEKHHNIIHIPESKEKLVYDLIDKKFRKKKFSNNLAGAFGVNWFTNITSVKKSYVPLFKEVREMYIRNEEETVNVSDIISPVLGHIISDYLLDLVNIVYDAVSNQIRLKLIYWTLGVTSAYIAKYNLELSKEMIEAVGKKVKEELDLKGKGLIGFFKEVANAENKFKASKEYLDSPKFYLVEKFLNKTPSELGL